MKHHAQLITRQGFGVVAKPVVYDLTKGALVKNAHISGAARYGRKSSEDNNERPLGLAYRAFPSDVASTQEDWVTNLVANAGANNPSLSDWTNPTAGPARTSYFNFEAVDVDMVTFDTREAIIKANAPWGINLLIDEQRSSIKNRGDKPVVWLEWGDGQHGYMLQIIGNQATIGEKSPLWNETDALAIRRYLMLREDSVTPENEAIVAKKIKQIYLDYEELSLENAVGKDEFQGQVFNLIFLPEPRGAIHILMGGADALRHDVSRILKTGIAGQVWGDSTLRIGTYAASFSWQLLKVVHFRESTIEYGPLRKNGIGEVEFTTSLNADQSGGTVTVEPFYSDAENDEPGDLLYGLGADYFGLRLTMTAGNDGQTTGWTYGYQATAVPPDHEFDETESFDSDDTEDPSPVVDVSIETEQSGRRSARVTMRDVNGKTLKNIGNAKNRSIHALRDRMADVPYNSKIGSTTYASGNLFTNAIVTGGRTLDAAHFAFERDAVLQQLAQDIAKGATAVEAEISDLWYILDETPCSPPPVLDGLPLGTALDKVWRIAGMHFSAGVGDGPILPVAALGEAFKSVPDGDSTCGDVGRSLMDRFGLGYRIIQGGNGLWRFEEIDTSHKFTFISNSSINSPDTTGGRNCILEPLDWQADNRDFYNFFEVIGGTEEKPIRATWTIHESISNPAFANWIGRLKPYQTLKDESLNTSAHVQRALRSMVQKNGKAGRYAQFTGYCRFDLLPGDRGTVDGIECELESIQGCSIATDQMQYVVREIV